MENIRWEDAAVEMEIEEAQQPPEEHGAQSPNPNYCGVTFDIPWSGSSCTPAMQESPPATQEELDHLKALLADTGGVLKKIEDTAALEAGKSRYQDIVSEALPDVREANVALHEILGKFLQELEDHIQVDDHPHVADEKKKLNEHLQIMDRMLQVTGRLAEQLDQASRSLLRTLNQPLEKAPALMYSQAPGPS